NQLAAFPADYGRRMHVRRVREREQSIVHDRRAWVGHLNPASAARQRVVHFEPVMIDLAVRQSERAGVEFPESRDGSAGAIGLLQFAADKLLKRRRIAVLNLPDDERRRFDRRPWAPKNEMRLPTF